MTSEGASRAGWRVSADALRTQLWPIPALAAMVAVALGAGLPVWDARIVGTLPDAVTGYLFSGGPEAARSVLQAVAGSLITVTSLTFSLTVVTLQLASSQHSPRLLRTFARDRVVHATLAVLLATFTFALTVLRTVRTEVDDDAAFVPQLSVTVAYLLAPVSILAVAGFLAHMARKIRVESMLRDVHDEAAGTLRRVLPELPPGRGPTAAPPPPPGDGFPVCARKSGFLTSVDERALLAAAVRADAVVRLDRVPGESVVAGTPVATVWATDGRPPGGDADEVLAGQVADAVRTGFERTSTQDVAFGLRQLVDVAVKSLSPGINDPTTAVHALSHTSALLCEAAGRDLGPRLLRDEAGRIRVVLRRPDFAALLDLAVSQPRRYAAEEPQVLARLLTMLRELAWTVREQGQRAAVADQLARLRAAIDRQGIDPAEHADLTAHAGLVEQALAGRWPADK
jgi:uncharacterized membrane protein